MSNPFEAAIEGFNQQHLDPENARRVLEWYQHLPGLIEAGADRLRRDAAALSDEFDTNPTAVEYANDVAATLGRVGQHAEEAMAVFMRIENERLRSALEPRPHEAKWDVAANRE